MEATGTDIAHYKAALRNGIMDAFSYERAIAPIDKDALLGKFRSLIDSINGFIVIANYTTGQYEYISDTIKAHLGYDVSGYNFEQLTNLILANIEERHREFLFTTFMPVVFNFLNDNMGKVNSINFRYACCIQMRNIKGKLIWYLIDTVVIESDEKGAPLRTLITCTDISLLKKDGLVYYNIQQRNEHDIYEIILEGTDNSHTLDINLTPRELQIIALIGVGYTNQEIADKIFVSLNTVKTHRKNILKKTDCKGTADLTNFAFTRGLL